VRLHSYNDNRLRTIPKRFRAYRTAQSH